MRLQTILLVGGAGFIGSYVNKLLHQEGYQTIVFDNLSQGNQKAVLEGQFFLGDIGNKEDLRHVFSKHSVDAVMHFAAKINIGESVSDPGLYYRNNVVATLNLLEVMREYGVNFFIFSSSAAVYGFPQQRIINESHPCLPINPYGETKLMVEKILCDFDRAYAFKSCSLRYFNAAGGDPEGKLKNFKAFESNLIPVILKSLKKGNEEIIIFGTDYDTPDGTCIRDYIHIHDLATAHIKAMNQLFQKGGTKCYNLGNEQGFSVREVIAAVEHVTGQKVNAKEGKRRPGDPPILVADARKALHELHWKPQYADLKTIIAHAWQSLS